MKKIKGRRILYLLLVGFLILVFFQEFLHNHQPQISNHSNCPVFILKQVVQYAPDAWVVLITACLVMLFNCSLKPVIFRTKLLSYTLGSRGPPFLR